MNRRESGTVGMGMRINGRGLENGRGRDGERGRRWCSEGKEGKTQLHNFSSVFHPSHRKTLASKISKPKTLRERFPKAEATKEEEEEAAKKREPKRELLPILNPPSLVLAGFFD